MADQGLLFVLGETGKDVSEAEFNDWYDNEHGPARLTVPGFTKAIRLRATDGKEPSYLAAYDMTSPDIAFGAGYKALNINPTPRDKDIVPRTDTLHRRVYNKISTLEKPGEHTFPTKFTTTVTFITPPEIDEVFNKWYEEEHVPQLSGVPGYVRCRRYKLVDSADLGRTKFPEPIPNYIAIYDTDKDNWMEEEAFLASLTTPMTIEMMKNPWEARRWRLHTELQPPK